MNRIIYDHVLHAVRISVSADVVFPGHHVLRGGIESFEALGS